MKKKLLTILLSVFMMSMVLPETVFAANYNVSSIDVSIETGYGEIPKASYEITPDDLTTDLKIIDYEYKDSKSTTPETLIEGDYTVNVTVEVKDSSKPDCSLSSASVTVNGSSDGISNLNQTAGKITFTYSFHVDGPSVSKTIADILPSGFPTSESNAWKTKTGAKMYIVDGSPNTLLYGSYGIQVTNELTKSGSDYTITTNNGDTLTFKMNDDVLEKVVVEGTDATKDGNAGTYTLSSKKVSFVMADSEKTTVIKDIVDGDVDEPVAPTITDYDFKGWYYCDNTSTGDGHFIGMVKLDPDNVVDKDITVYAAYLLNCIYNGESGNIDFIKTNFVGPNYNEKFSYDDGKTYKDNKSMPNEPGTYSVWMQGRNYGTKFTEYFMKVGDAIITVNYEITDGNQATINTDDNKDVLFTSTADFSKFVRVDVDNVTVDPSKYSAVSGSTKITMKASYLNTLAEGNHTLTIVSNDGKASTTFTITKGSKPSPTPTPKPGYVAPKTGIN